MRRTGGIALVVVATLGCSVSTGDEPLGRRGQPLTSGLVINECASGKSGYVELFNGGATTVDLAQDASACWFVDDVAGGGSPKQITDSVVAHGAGSTTCASAGRPTTCALVAPGEIVWIPYAYVNATSTDACRLLTASKSGTKCGNDYVDQGVGGATASSSSGQCFGRTHDGGPWSTSPIACTKGDSNGAACAVGASCEDGNACTSGETIQSDCTCGGGTPAPDGASCGAGATCASGVCTSTSGPVLEKTGVVDKVLLKGTIVTPDVAFAGEVLIEGDVITCVSSSCSSEPGAANASIVQTNGLVFPGLVDTHNHVLFDIFDESDWSPTKTYSNHNQWTSDPRYQALVDAKQYLNGEGSSVSFGCEMNKYGELKGLIAGTTSMVGAANPANKACYGSLARTIDQSPNDLGADTMQVATLLPSTSTADSVCANFASGATTAYVIHLGEGVDATALGEWDKLWSVPSTDGCLHVSQTTIVHGTAFGDAQLTAMAARGMSLVWSPRSNVFLYGAGSDLTKTTNVPLALSKGINVALAPDWSIGGSQNLLDELRFANHVDDVTWGNVLDAKQLVHMVTLGAAKALKLDAKIGSIAVGKKADLVVVSGDATKPWDALLAATPREVQLVMVGGVSLYGNKALEPLAATATTPGCEAFDACGASKFLCVAEASSSDKLGQTYAELRDTLETELQKYDALGLTSYKFAPIAPLLRCP